MLYAGKLQYCILFIFVSHKLLAVKTSTMVKKTTSLFLSSFILISTLFISCKSGKKDFQEINWANFEWAGDSLGNKYFDKVAMFIPVNFKGVPHNFLAQLDLGSDISIVYGNSFKSYLSTYPEFGRKLDTILSEVAIGNESQGEIKDIELSLDSFLTQLKSVVYYKKFGSEIPTDSIASLTKKHIGIIGADIVKNKVLLIDYKNNRIAIVDSLNLKQTDKFNFLDCKITNGRIKLPLIINGETQWYMFETGSSIFPLVTDENNWKSMCDVSKKEAIKISSKDKSYDILGAETNKDIFFGKEKMPKTHAYVMPLNLNGYTEMFKQEDVKGTIGNACFLNTIIAIDFKQSKFGVLKAN